MECFQQLTTNPAMFSTSWLRFFSIHEIFSILLKNHISSACSFFIIISNWRKINNRK